MRSVIPPEVVKLNEKGGVLDAVSVSVAVEQTPSRDTPDLVGRPYLVQLTVGVEVSCHNGKRSRATAVAKSPCFVMSEELVEHHLGLRGPLTPDAVERKLVQRLAQTGPSSFPLLLQLARGRLPFTSCAEPGFLHLAERSGEKALATQAASLLLSLLVAPIVDINPALGGVVFAIWDRPHPSIVEVNGDPNKLRERLIKANLLFFGKTGNTQKFAVEIYKQLSGGALCG